MNDAIVLVFSPQGDACFVVPESCNRYRMLADDPPFHLVGLLRSADRELEAFAADGRPVPIYSRPG